jgi:hypothetical protein
MKLLQYPNNCHPKNRESIQRMCKEWNIQYEATNDRKKCNDPSVTILWLPMMWISPDEFPGKYILYGPHHFVFPQGQLIGPLNKEWAKRCVYTTLSDWNLKVFAEFAKETVIPLKALSFGINPTIQDSSRIPKIIDCIIYFKRRDPNLLKTVCKQVEELGLRFKVFTYGTYKNEEYINSLKIAKCCIWIGTHESQGFAFQECLASNVPILCLDASTMFEELTPRGISQYEHLKGKRLLQSTTATQWSPECGIKITEMNEFKSALTLLLEDTTKYQPRTFILSKVSDHIAMKDILETFQLL